MVGVADASKANGFQRKIEDFSSNMSARRECARGHAQGERIDGCIRVRCAIPAEVADRPEYRARLRFGQVNPQNKSVKGYSKKNGTYVQPHRRTVENATNRDNYTTKPNANPYTAKKGYIQPDNKPKSTSSGRKRK